MKITIVMGFFLPVPPAAGGATEKSWHQLALEFARLGHEVTLVTRTWRDWPSQETQDGVRYLRLPGHDHTGSLPRNLWPDLRWSLRVWRQLPAADITIVNCISLPILLGWNRRRAGKVVVMTGRMPKGQYRLYRRVDRVLAVSTPVRAAVLAEKPRFEPLIKITGYPIHWQMLAEGRLWAPAGPLTLGFIGRIHREKGLDLFVAALAELAKRSGLPPWRVILCGPQEISQGGSGPDYAADLKRQLTETLPPDAFEFLPPLFAREKLADIYRRLDIFCYPSLAARGETFGVAVAEAMAAGAVPVVSQLDCFGDFVRPGESGVVFDQTAPDAPIQLADQLARLLSDDNYRRRLAAAACAATERYDFAVFARQLLTDFSTLK